jgi:predicted phage gp36 major capsid-like protein
MSEKRQKLKEELLLSSKDKLVESILKTWADIIQYETTETELRAEVERLKAEMKADNRRLVGEVERFRKEWQEAIEGNTRLSKQLDQALAQLEAAAKWLDEKSRAGRISDTEDRLELYRIINPEEGE